MTKKAIVLFSGGLDSTTCLAIAKSQDFTIYALSFDYNQRHRGELKAAEWIAKIYQVKAHQVISLDLAVFGGSALTDATIDVPVFQESQDIPMTYVPARNTIFLSYALAYAEVMDCQDIFIGANQIDYSRYPDCREAYLDAFQCMANLATKQGVAGHRLKIHAPLLQMSKAEIITTGLKLGVDYALTVSCYQLDENNHACGRCDACHFRKEGFKSAGVNDPTPYAAYKKSS